jgi:hypothetical protein
VALWSLQSFVDGWCLPDSFLLSALCAGSIDASRSSVSIPALPSLPAGSASSIQIQARDAYGNARTQGGQGFTVWLTSGAQSLNGVPVDNGDGSYIYPFNLTAAGSYSLVVAYKSVNVPSSPYTLTVLPGQHSGTFLTPLLEINCKAKSDRQIIKRDLAKHSLCRL